jgi:chromosome segregation ATPase
MTDHQLSLEPPHDEGTEAASPSPARPWTDETASEVARLEELLRDRANELQTQKNRARQAEAAVRDLMAQLEAAARLTLPADDLSSLRARTLEAEIGRAEIQLRFDELLGHFTALSARDDSRAQLEAAQAELAGRERGLRAALAEAEENRDFAQARATLLDHDLTLMRDARADAIRETAETRDQLELAITQLATLTARFEHGLPSVQAETLQGERSGLRFRLDEQERAAAIASTLLQAARADGQEQRRVLGQVRVELSARQSDHREHASRAEHLERELARERERSRELAGKHAQQTAEADSLREELTASLADVTLLRNALRVLEEGAAVAGRDAGSARTTAGAAAQRSAALTQAVQTARRALVSLQTQLRLVHDETLSGTGEATEPGMLSFDEVEEQA